QECVERAATADDAEDQLRDEPTILWRQRRGRECVVDQFGGERLAGAGPVQHVGRDSPGGRHDSTSGPNRMPSVIGCPRRNSCTVIRFFPAGWTSVMHSIRAPDFT